VDTPQGLYRGPAYTIVASFIGSPPMNFIRGRLDDGAVQLGPYRIELPGELRPRIRKGTAGDVLVGLRPEEFEDARVDSSGATVVLPVLIEITEQLGPETYAYFRVEGLDVVEIGDRPLDLGGALSARLDPRTSAAPGESLRLAVNPGGLQLFDLGTGESLLSP
jgi:multiple sugar transport system ATP-binding protein